MVGRNPVENCDVSDPVDSGHVTTVPSRHAEQKERNMTQTPTQFPSSPSAQRDPHAPAPHRDTRAASVQSDIASNAYTSAGIAASPRALVTLRHNSDRRSIEAALERLGYSVRATNDPIATEVLLRTYGPDIIVVDAREAYPTSSDLLQQIRRCPDIHTVVVGADTDDQRIIALRNGADDVVSTDITPDEVALRCQAILRRQQAEQSSFAGGNPRVLYFGPLSIDLGRREIRVDRKVIPATRLEFDLFAHLCQRPLEVCSRPDLLTGVWGPHWVGDSHVVDVHLSNLRRKLSEHRHDLPFIQTVRGVGFRLADELLLAASEDLASQRQLAIHLDGVTGRVQSDTIGAALHGSS